MMLCTSPICFKRLTVTLTPDMLILGDFNVVLDVNIDRTDPVSNNVNAHRVLTQQMDLRDLCDIWRIKNPNKVHYSWRRSAPSLTGSRLDYVLVNNMLINKVSSIEYVECPFTDHDTVICQLHLSNTKRGPGYWKFNNYLLSDPVFCTATREIIKRVVNCNASSDPCSKMGLP